MTKSALFTLWQIIQRRSLNAILICRRCRDKNVRWKIEGLKYPIDAQMVGPDRLIVAEYQGHAVSERTTKGDVIWLAESGVGKIARVTIKTATSTQ